ncbi:MAG TPA: GYD domain-containing protein [Duganella sp.]|nr:GYD domain-containing protein [Duganella sp.]
MHTFILLSRLDPEVLRTPASLEDYEKRAMEHIRQDCPDVNWMHSYALLGPYDYLDIFRAQDMESALKVSALIRTYGRAHSEIWAATEWENFKNIIHSLAPRQ